MPTSAYQNTAYVLEFVCGLEPKSVLDVGAGFGRWGFLCRCHAAGGHSLTAQPDQSLRIDGIEGYPGNISPIYQAVYDNTYEGDARELVPSLGAYDVIICGDMIEHLDKDEAWALIKEMRQHAAKALVLALPFGNCPQEAIYGNELEVHRSVWGRADFAGSGARIRTFPFFLPGVRIAVAIWPLSDDARWLLKTMRNPVRRFLVSRMAHLLRAVRRARRDWT